MNPKRNPPSPEFRRKTAPGVATPAATLSDTCFARILASLTEKFSAWREPRRCPKFHSELAWMMGVIV
jgi:hypothetical protein